MIIGIKIGSAVLVDEKGNINDDIIKNVSEQVAQLSVSGHKLFIVTSGAVACNKNKKRSKNLRSAIGQGKLINKYSACFKKYGIEVAQILLTDEQLREGRDAVIGRTLSEAFEQSVIPIINGNDAIDDEEIRALEVCADNDMLFKLVCYLVDANMAIIGFDEKGLLDEDGNVIRKVYIGRMEKYLLLANGGGKLGHGKEGMKTKLECLIEMTERGIKCFLVPGKERNSIIRVFYGEHHFGTKFVK